MLLNFHNDNGILLVVLFLKFATPHIIILRLYIFLSNHPTIVDTRNLISNSDSYASNIALILHIRSPATIC